MKLDTQPAALMARCSQCAEEIELTAYAASLGNRDIMCRNCMRMPTRGKWTPQLYHEYLQTEHWQRTREAAMDRAGHRCQVCAKTERLEVHHNSYDNLGGEPLVDLVLLCRGCHELFHGKDM